MKEDSEIKSLIYDKQFCHNCFPFVLHRKRFIYAFHCHYGPGISTPLTVDITGTYFRREGLGGMYICGASPESEVSLSQGACLLSVVLAHLN